MQDLWLYRGYIYDLTEGDPDGNVETGTPFEKLPEDWTCPVCGAPKGQFERIDGAEEL